MVGCNSDRQFICDRTHSMMPPYFVWDEGGPAERCLPDWLTLAEETSRVHVLALAVVLRDWRERGFGTCVQAVR